MTILQVGDVIPDVSKHRGRIQWNLVPAKGAVIRAGYGTDIDIEFIRNMKGSNENGKVRGTYHFLRWTQDPIYQGAALANWFSDLTSPLPELNIAGDYEKDGHFDNDGKWVWDEPPSARLILQHIEAYLKEAARQSIIVEAGYTSPGFWNYYVIKRFSSIPEWVKKLELWVAHWGVLVPAAVRGFLVAVLHQYTAQGRMDGIAPPVDLNKVLDPIRLMREKPTIPDDHEGRIAGLETWARGLSYGG